MMSEEARGIMFILLMGTLLFKTPINAKKEEAI